MGRLDGKVAIITGAARGMGETTARLFAKEGAQVVIGDVLDKEGQAVADSIGEQAHYLHLDVTSEADWQKAVALASSLGSYNVLVNNAAILYYAAITEATPDDYLKVIRVNQLGPYIGIRESFAAMKAAGGGSIINISSIDGLQSKNGLSAYSSTKWALRGLTKSAALEYGPHNIRVNTVHPGGVFTAMHAAGDKTEPNDDDNAFYVNHPLPRVGLPIEIANMSLYLASDDSSYSTGSEFIVDGGWNAGMRLDLLPTS
ncbi:glucose 1-dehydrogenase [Litorivivens sp.]|uniref:glucose 1-dehydrogenase n=1 Tax=Litorivivens sp. TaxID=2020868 RepID=UPI0035682234